MAPDGVHWSFFLDSGASVLGGNTLAERAGGRWETVDFARGYGPLDQYAMGLRAPSEVPPVLLVAEADGFSPVGPFKPSSSPQGGVSFSGVARRVSLAEVQAAMGPRVPDAAASPHVLAQAYVLVAGPQDPATPERVAALSRIRTRFESWFAAATDGRGQATTSVP
jgi:hypothetical protein